MQNEKGGNSPTANIKFLSSPLPVECPTCWTKVSLFFIDSSYFMSLVILTPSAWAASFNKNNVVHPFPHYVLVEVILWRVGATCRAERRSSTFCRSTLITQLMYNRWVTKLSLLFPLLRLHSLGAKWAETAHVQPTWY